MNVLGDAAKKADVAVRAETGPAVNADLHKVLENIRKLQASGNTNSAKVQYAIGKLVHQVQDNPQKFGHESDETAVKFMAKQLGCGKDTLYNAARVSLCWKPNEFGGWLKKKGDSGARLSLGHFNEVLRLHDPNLRDELLARALAEGMSTRDVRKAVLAEQPAKPKAPSNRLAKLIDSSEGALKAWRNVDGLAGGTGVAEVVLIDKLAELQQQLSVLCLENGKVLRGIRDSLVVTAVTSGPPAPGVDDSGAQQVVAEVAADIPLAAMDAGACTATPVLVAANGEGTAAEVVVAPQLSTLPALAVPAARAATRPRLRRHKTTDLSNVS